MGLAGWLWNELGTVVALHSTPPQESSCKESFHHQCIYIYGGRFTLHFFGALAEMRSRLFVGGGGGGGWKLPKVQ